MSKIERKTWTTKEVNALLELACDEFEKEFFKALATGARKNKLTKRKLSLLDPAKIIAEAKKRVGKK